MIGGGILGLAVARALLVSARRARSSSWSRPSASSAQHQTGRASGVVHRGLYYAPGSLKARLCVEGGVRCSGTATRRGSLTASAASSWSPTRPEELLRLEALHERGLANGVPGLELAGPERIARARAARRPAFGRSIRRRRASSISPTSPAPTRPTSSPRAARSGPAGASRGFAAVAARCCSRRARVISRHGAWSPVSASTRTGSRG